jgi:chorismate mutase
MYKKYKKYKKYKGGRAFRALSTAYSSQDFRAPLRRSPAVCVYPPYRFTALRGAARAENTSEDISAQSAALYAALLRRNNLAESDVASVIFSLTPDLDAQNPAAALRAAGYAAATPLFTAQEALIQGGMTRVIRILVHCLLPNDAEARHVYHNGAEALRPDLP